MFACRRLCSCIFLYFFFSCYADPRDLHSFPTRRSSDLSSLPKLLNTFCVFRSSPANLAGNIPDPICRSEEHTSELQSLRHLVCRLLLEKKKKKYTLTINK